MPRLRRAAFFVGALAIAAAALIIASRFRTQAFRAGLCGRLLTQDGNFLCQSGAYEQAIQAERLLLVTDDDPEHVARAGEVGNLPIGAAGDAGDPVAQSAEPQSPADLVESARRLRCLDRLVRRAHHLQPEHLAIKISGCRN